MNDHPKRSAVPLSPFLPPIFSKAGINRDEENKKRREEYIRKFGKRGLRIGDTGTLFGLPFGVHDARQSFLYFVTSRPAIQLSKDQRRAAANDPALEYDPTIYGYRRKRRRS